MDSGVWILVQVIPFQVPGMENKTFSMNACFLETWKCCFRACCEIDTNSKCFIVLNVLEYFSRAPPKNKTSVLNVLESRPAFFSSQFLIEEGLLKTFHLIWTEKKYGQTVCSHATTLSQSNVRLKHIKTNYGQVRYSLLTHPDHKLTKKWSLFFQLRIIQGNKGSS